LGKTNWASNLIFIINIYICIHKIMEQNIQIIPKISFPIKTKGFTFYILSSNLNS
jgi:hypothetical protein